jgi:hypothetical protein
MRKLSFIIAILTIFFMVNSAYSLPNFWYSGVAYNSLGQIMPNANVEVNITVTDGSLTYIEQFLSGGTGPIPSDPFGVVSVNVGTGTPVSGTLAPITMVAATKITVKVRPVGGLTWVPIVSTSLSTTYVNQYVNIGSIELEEGHILIGNADNNAEAHLVSGDATLSSDGVIAISPGVIVDADINANANIGVNKLQDGGTDEVLLTNGVDNSWGKVGTNFISDGAITTAKLADGAVTNGKLLQVLFFLEILI